MRHSNSGKKLSRTPAHRKALLHNLAKALLIHGRIRTTEVKAKELRGVVEPLISLAKRNDLHARRLAYRVLCDWLSACLTKLVPSSPVCLVVTPA